MSAPFSSDAPLGHSADLIAALRADLRAASYDVSTCEELMGGLAAGALRRENPLPARTALRSRTETAATLYLLWALGEEVSAEALAQALPALGIEGATTLGLIEMASAPEATPATYRATVMLSPYEATDDLGSISWWIASDLSELATGKALEGEHVLGVGGASLTLARITPRRQVERALDLGCGGGIQAMHLARHSDHVTATDLSRRALDFAAFNAALNEISLDLRHGSLWEPVSGETFDLIVTNPPFVITPRSSDEDTWTYRDGGQAGDSLLAQLLTELPTHLAPGGTAHMLGNWEITSDEPWDAHPRAWLAAASSAGVDSWVIEREQEDPAQYAETWARDGGIIDRDLRWAPLIRHWLDDFASRDVTSIGFGWIQLHRPATMIHRAGVIRTEQASGTGSGTLGEHLARSLSMVSTVADLSTDELFSSRLTRAEDVMERRFVVPGQWDPIRIDLVQGGGVAREVGAGQTLAATVGACDGTLTLGQIIDAVCALTEADPQDERETLEPQIRDLLVGGILQLS